MVSYSRWPCSARSRYRDSPSSEPSVRWSTVFASERRSEPRGFTSKCGPSTGRTVRYRGTRSNATKRGDTSRFASSADGESGGRRESSRTASAAIAEGGSGERTDVRPRRVTTGRRVRQRDQRTLRELTVHRSGSTSSTDGGVQFGPLQVRLGAGQSPEYVHRGSRSHLLRTSVECQYR